MGASIVVGLVFTGMAHWRRWRLPQTGGSTLTYSQLKALRTKALVRRVNPKSAPLPRLRRRRCSRAQALQDVAPVPMMALGLTIGAGFFLNRLRSARAGPCVLRGRRPSSCVGHAGAGGTGVAADAGFLLRLRRGRDRSVGRFLRSGWLYWVMLIMVSGLRSRARRGFSSALVPEVPQWVVALVIVDCNWWN